MSDLATETPLAAVPVVKAPPPSLECTAEAAKTYVAQHDLIRFGGAIPPEEAVALLNHIMAALPVDWIGQHVNRKEAQWELDALIGRNRKAEALNEFARTAVRGTEFCIDQKMQQFQEVSIREEVLRNKSDSTASLGAMLYPTASKIAHAALMEETRQLPEAAPKEVIKLRLRESFMHPDIHQYFGVACDAAPHLA